MYNDMIYRNDELKRELEQADRNAARGWRVWTTQSREPRLLNSALAVLGRTFIAVGQWLVARQSEPAVPGQLGLTSAA